MNERNTVVGVFADRNNAQQAIEELRRAGFQDDQIGLMASGDSDYGTTASEASETYAAEGGATGLAAGAGVGALWGLGIAAGMLPAIGPAIAGGTLAIVLSSAAAGAAAAGLGGTLVGLGIPKEEAEYYESELKSGRIILTVRPDGRNSEAMAILRRFGGYDASNQGETWRVEAPTPQAPSSHSGSRNVHVPVSDQEVGRDVATQDKVAGVTPGSPAVPRPARHEQTHLHQPPRDGEVC